ncbi:hypothetical protein JEQ00_04875 [Serratia marcescens]|uniref:hypothetical protein n=1 Tax=Serratia marcescens TaxID=615 RepID=UPI001A287438|nr:hypothetical protein [Serratia marcescens]MBI6170323.1 hypothetical protein [Serratia marcescens]
MKIAVDSQSETHEIINSALNGGCLDQLKDLVSAQMEEKRIHRKPTFNDLYIEIYNTISFVKNEIKKSEQTD